jgi:glycosyltransferase EpsH
MVKVSLIVPIYNAQDYLDKCINSLIKQTLKDIEIILINDGSTDDSEKIVKKYKDKRIVYISKENEGIGKTRNKGIDIAKGKYIAFIDADDYITLDFCEKMYTKAIEDQLDVVVCDYYNYANNNYNHIYLKDFALTKLSDTPNLLLNINLGPCNKIYNLDFLKNNHIKFIENLKYEDVPFVCECLLKAKKIGKENEALNYFRIHDGSQTTVRNDKIFDILKIMEIIKNIFKDAKYKEVLYNLVINLVLDYAVQTRYIKNKQIRSQFIDLTYQMLNKFNSNWQKYINQKNVFKKMILKHKYLLKLYCTLYSR